MVNYFDSLSLSLKGNLQVHCIIKLALELWLFINISTCLAPNLIDVALFLIIWLYILYANKNLSKVKAVLFKFSPTVEWPIVCLSCWLHECVCNSLYLGQIMGHAARHHALPQDIFQIFLMDHAQEILNLRHCLFAAKNKTENIREKLKEYERNIYDSQHSKNN